MYRVARIELAKKRKSERQVIQKKMSPTKATAAMADITENEKQRWQKSMARLSPTEAMAARAELKKIKKINDGRRVWQS